MNSKVEQTANYFCNKYNKTLVSLWVTALPN